MIPKLHTSTFLPTWKEDNRNTKLWFSPVGLPTVGQSVLSINLNTEDDTVGVHLCTTLTIRIDFVSLWVEWIFLGIEVVVFEVLSGTDSGNLHAHIGEGVIQIFQ